MKDVAKTNDDEKERVEKVVGKMEVEIANGVKDESTTTTMTTATTENGVMRLGETAFKMEREEVGAKPMEVDEEAEKKL